MLRETCVTEAVISWSEAPAFSAAPASVSIESRSEPMAASVLAHRGRRLLGPRALDGGGEREVAAAGRQVARDARDGLGEARERGEDPLHRDHQAVERLGERRLARAGEGRARERQVARGRAVEGVARRLAGAEDAAGRETAESGDDGGGQDAGGERAEGGGVRVERRGAAKPRRTTAGASAAESHAFAPDGTFVDAAGIDPDATLPGPSGPPRRGSETEPPSRVPRPPGNPRPRPERRRRPPAGAARAGSLDRPARRRSATRSRPRRATRSSRPASGSGPASSSSPASSSARRRRRLLDPACAVEMIHAASLALDDLPSMDDATTRRGRPALHAVHGEDLAILAAVTLIVAGLRRPGRRRPLDDPARRRARPRLAPRGRLRPPGPRLGAVARPQDRGGGGVVRPARDDPRPQDGSALRRGGGVRGGPRRGAAEGAGGGPLLRQERRPGVPDRRRPPRAAGPGPDREARRGALRHRPSPVTSARRGRGGSCRS